MKTNEKKTFTRNGKKYYYLGQDAEGVNYWLETANWDCGWYWGGGYVETFTNNNNPQLSRDISSHSHFDYMLFNKECGFDAFKKLFINNPFTDKEIWTICELMKAFYTARSYSDMIYRGGAHYTTNPAKDIIKSDEEYNRINKKVIPAIFTELYKILEK